MSNPAALSTPEAATDLERGIILATVVLAATPEKVFHALTDKAEIETWWGSDDEYWMQDYDADFRIGGGYRIVGRGSDGVGYGATGSFIEIAGPHKLTYTRAYEFDFPVLGRRITTITYLCDKVEEGTRLTIRHEGFQGCNDAALFHAERWKLPLIWLAAHVNELEEMPVMKKQSVHLGHAAAQQASLK